MLIDATAFRAILIHRDAHSCPSTYLHGGL